MRFRRSSRLLVGVVALAGVGLSGSCRRNRDQPDDERGELEQRDDPNRASLMHTFNKVYASGQWAKGADGKGTSGPGSTPETTAAYRTFLEDFLKTHKVKSVMDAGCGDWAFSSSVNWHGARYTGVDISSDVIEEVRKKHASARVRFLVGNITEPLPAADLLLCKDVLQHLPNALIQRFIANNLQPGKFKWAILTNDQGSDNADIEPGEYRTIDLRKPPFGVKDLVDLPIRFPERPEKLAQLLDFTRR